MKSRFKSKQLKKTHRTLSELDFIDMCQLPTVHLVISALGSSIISLPPTHIKTSFQRPVDSYIFTSVKYTERQTSPQKIPGRES